MQVLLSNSHAGQLSESRKKSLATMYRAPKRYADLFKKDPGRAKQNRYIKYEQEQTSPNHLQIICGSSVQA